MCAMFNNNNTGNRNNPFQPGGGLGGNQSNNNNTSFLNNANNQQIARGGPFMSNTGANTGGIGGTGIGGNAGGAGNNLFNNMNQGQQQGQNNTGNNMFNNMNTGGGQGGGGIGVGMMGGQGQVGNNPGNNIFNNMANNQAGGQGMMGGQGGNNPGNNMFNNNNLFRNNMGGNNMGNNMGMGTNMGMGNNMTNTGNNLFSNNPMNNNNNMNNPMTNQQYNNNPNNFNNNNPYQFNYQTRNQLQTFQNSLQNTKLQLQDCLRKMSTRNLQSIRIDTWNTYKDKPLNSLPLKDQAIKILVNFHQLKKIIETLKKSNQEIQKKMSTYSKQTHKKLTIYKKCLLQTISHNKLIQQISSQLDLMNKQIQDYFKPLYNAYKYKKKISIRQPNQFDLKISYDILNKLQALNQRVDDMIACQINNNNNNNNFNNSNNNNNNISNQQVQNTINVFQQLIQYYQNVSCSFKDFSYRYNKLKRQAIEKQRGRNYQAVMSKVIDKVQENLKKQFMYYDIIKEIDQLLAEKQKRQEKKRIQAYNKFQANARKTYF